MCDRSINTPSCLRRTPRSSLSSSTQSPHCWFAAKTNIALSAACLLRRYLKQDKPPKQRITHSLVSARHRQRCNCAHAKVLFLHREFLKTDFFESAEAQLLGRRYGGTMACSAMASRSMACGTMRRRTMRCAHFSIEPAIYQLLQACLPAKMLG